MIELIPSRTIVKATNINFDILSSIISQFIKLKTQTTFKCEKSRYCFSEICLEKRIIRLFISENNNLQYYVSTIIHEIRHFMQYLSYKDLTYNYESYKAYYYSPEERDARKFEIIATDICKIYNAHISIKEKFEKYQFNTLKELDDNYGKR